MTEEQRPNYRMLYDGRIDAPIPSVGAHDFYADSHQEARGTARRTIMDWNREHPSFGLVGLLPLGEQGNPLGEDILEKR